MTDSEEKNAPEFPASESRFSLLARFAGRNSLLIGVVAAIAAAWAAAELYGDFPRPALGIVLLGAAARSKCRSVARRGARVGFGEGSQYWRPSPNASVLLQ